MNIRRKLAEIRQATGRQVELYYVDGEWALTVVDENKQGDAYFRQTKRKVIATGRCPEDVISNAENVAKRQDPRRVVAGKLGLSRNYVYAPTNYLIENNQSDDPPE